MKIATIILNWNGLTDTIDCLDSLSRATIDGWQNDVVVVDNGSSDDSIETLKRDYPSVIILPQSKNLGFARGNNIAMQWAIDQQYQAVILLNNDTVVATDALQKMIDLWKSKPEAGAIMPLFWVHGSRDVWYSEGKLLRPWGRIQHYHNAELTAPHQIEIFTACCVLIPVPVLQHVGQFDERYYLYLEDTDLALRIGRSGYAIWAEPRAIIEHKISRSSGGAVTADPIYYQIRNNLLLIHDHEKLFFNRWIGYGYVFILSLKISGNIWMGSMYHKRQLMKAVVQAWTNGVTGVWGKRR